jgi:hypothetical protein
MSSCHKETTRRNMPHFVFNWERSIGSVKSEVIKTVHALIHESIFGTRPWLAGPDILCELSERVESLGLVEPVPGEANTWRVTLLGKELNFDLMQVFMGLWEPWEIPFILKENGLISEREECEAVTHLNEAGEQGTEEDLEPILLPLVRRAFFIYFQGNTRNN